MIVLELAKNGDLRACLHKVRPMYVQIIIILIHKMRNQNSIAVQERWHHHHYLTSCWGTVVRLPQVWSTCPRRALYTGTLLPGTSWWMMRGHVRWEGLGHYNYMIYIIMWLYVVNKSLFWHADCRLWIVQRCVWGWRLCISRRNDSS